MRRSFYSHPPAKVLHTGLPPAQFLSPHQTNLRQVLQGFAETTTTIMHHTTLITVALIVVLTAWGILFAEIFFNNRNH